ncbi:hypothetical protein [Quadrisphaera sp. KR29]|uniref:hypothetical protein n=1 Tax=Quadrisphaera sp. KR29 TaxID=3461391 RepID=UPI004043D847
MVMLAEHYDYVIGGDPDRDTIDLAVLHAASGAVQVHVVEPANAGGYARLLTWARTHARGRRGSSTAASGASSSTCTTPRTESERGHWLRTRTSSSRTSGQG